MEKNELLYADQILSGPAFNGPARRQVDAVLGYRGKNRKWLAGELRTIDGQPPEPNTVYRWWGKTKNNSRRVGQGYRLQIEKLLGVRSDIPW